MAAILITVEIINFGEVCLAIGEESIYVLNNSEAHHAYKAMRFTLFSTSYGVFYFFIDPTQERQHCGGGP